MNRALDMLALLVDYNERERLPDGGQAPHIVTGKMNPDALEQRLEIGMRVVLYDDEIRCQGVLRKGIWHDGWVADIVPGTIEDLSPGEFERLRTVTKRAALRVVR